MVVEAKLMDFLRSLSPDELQGLTDAHTAVERRLRMRLETPTENIARDIKEGRFPKGQMNE